MSDIFKAKLSSARIAPRKARLVVDLIRGKSVEDALEVLKFTNKKAAPMVSKLINSAWANAKARYMVDVESIYVSEAFVDEGPTMKRFLPRAQGRATPIRKRTSHIVIKLKEK